MARYSKAQWRPLAAGSPPNMAAHNIICLHTMVGYLVGTDVMFKRDGWTGTESHFGIGGKWGSDVTPGLDGTVYQWVDTAHQADANYRGSREILSIETADNAPAAVDDLAEWTPKQLDSIVDLVVWLCRTHNIPPVLIPDTRPGRRGIAYHRQGCKHSEGFKQPGSGWLVQGGVEWSTSLGKGCPGPRRIAQLRGIVIPRVRAALAPPPPPAPKPEPPKENPVADVTDFMKVTLNTQVQVNAMNSMFDEPVWELGDVLDFDRLAKWGGPQDERMFKALTRLVGALDAEAEAREDTATALARIEESLATLRVAVKSLT